MLIAELKEL
ncbi:uncharacterized protein FFFS_14537 [Fusarium fujikuroi]|nr:uncharacterized protein FFFS_14537 [Fusarium fujikuroi]